MGGLFFTDLDTGNTTIIATANETGASGDGLVVDGDRLYVNLNAVNQLAVFDLSRENGTVASTYVGYITSPLFDSPSTTAQYKNFLYSVNARFGTITGLPAATEGDATFAEEFSVVQTSKRVVIKA